MRPTSVARAIAKAMADQGPPEETILRRSSLLQVRIPRWHIFQTIFQSQSLTSLTGGAEQQRMWLGSFGDRDGCSGSHVSAVDLA